MICVRRGKKTMKTQFLPWTKAWAAKILPCFWNKSIPWDGPMLQWVFWLISAEALFAVLLVRRKVVEPNPYQNFKTALILQNCDTKLRLAGQFCYNMLTRLFKFEFSLKRVLLWFMILEKSYTGIWYDMTGHDTKHRSNISECWIYVPKSRDSSIKMQI